MGIFLFTSIKELWDYFSHHPHPRKACPAHSLSSLLPCSFPGGQGRREQERTGCCTPRSHRNSWSLPCAMATEALGTPVCSKNTSDLLNTLQTDLSTVILFSLNLPNPKHSACNFTVQCNNGVGVHGARTEPAGASLSAEEWPKHLPWECQAVEKAEPLLRNDRHRWALVRQNQGQVLLFT